MAWTATPSAGEPLQASTLASLITELRPNTVAKASTTPRTSNATPANDPELALALAVGTWDVEAVLFVTSATDAAGDFRHQWAWTGTMTISTGTTAPADNLASGTTSSLETSPAAVLDSTTPSTTSVSTGASAMTTTHRLRARAVVTVAGTLTLQWSQAVSNASSTSLLAGSWLTATRSA